MRAEARGRDFFARVVAGILVLAAAAAAIAAVAIALGLGKTESLSVRVARIATDATIAARPRSDPFAFKASSKSVFEARAALGESHVIYALSPGGVVASAKRTARFRPAIEAAARAHGVAPETLEAIIFLESAGRPDAIAGPTPESASGLAQILPSTATDLLGMNVDLPRSIALTKQISNSKSPGATRELEDRRAAVDARFDPQAAIDGAARYLEIARDRFGTTDLAIASYHMGIGNLETVIRAYTRADQATPIGDVVAARKLSYAQLYFDSGLAEHSRSWDLLAGFGDESSAYEWKVLASERIMSRYRNDPEALAATADLADNKATMEEVYHPESETQVFDHPDDIEAALRDGDLVPLPDDPALGWRPDRDVGELAAQLDQQPELYHALRPEALATLTYMARLVKHLSHSDVPLRVTSAVRDREYQDALVESNQQATEEYSLHTTGWAFDVRREYASDRQAQAFQFVLDRLKALSLIDYAVEPGAIHVTVSELGRELLKP